MVRLPAAPSIWAVVACLAALVVARPAAAELCDTPVYNPDTKSYFELVCRGSGFESGVTWFAASVFARQKVFKDVHGRLAVVKTKQVNDFLLETFKPDRPAWIGLRYICAYRKLIWVTGDLQPFDGWSNWAQPWNLYGGLSIGVPRDCDAEGGGGYKPVHYWPASEGFEWNANGASKAWTEYFVEYPTGKD
jgi:hypothetical protein